MTTTIINHGQDIKIISWEMVNGFLYVQAWHEGAASGWLRASHISCEDMQIRPLLDPDWYEERWQVHSAHCRIRVSHGDYDRLGVDEEAEAMGFDAREIRNMRAAMEGQDDQPAGYTYVSLEVGKPFRKGWEAWWDCHITIAYAAAMSWRHMCVLFERLTQTLDKWKALEPQERPDNLLHLRKWEIKKPEEVGYDVFTYQDIANKQWGAVEKLVADGLIDSTSLVAPADLPAYIERLYQRDIARLVEARRRAETLLPHNGVLDMI